jgi:hypothetical protein
MRRALPAILVVALLAGCGGSGMKTSQLTREQYIEALDDLCTSANQEIAALKLTTSMATWKKNGERAAKIAGRTVSRFEALVPPDSLRDAAKRNNDASEGIVTSVEDAAAAAKKGDTAAFDEALSRQANFVLKRGTAAREIGATACS